MVRTHTFHTPLLAQLAVIASRWAAKMEDPPKPPAPQDPPQPRVVTEYVDADVDALVRKYGTKERAIKKLWRDAKRGRDGKTAALEQVRVLKEKYEAPGSVVLTPEQKSEWDAFQKLGKKAAEIGTILTQHGELSGKVAKAEREKTARTLAKVLQWDPEKTVRMVDKENLNVVVKKEKNDDDVEEEVAYVIPAGENQQPVRADKYAKEHLELYLPALVAGSNDSPGGATGGARGIPWLEQPSSSEQSGNRPDPARKGVPSIPALAPGRYLTPAQRQAAAAKKDT